MASLRSTGGVCDQTADNVNLAVRRGVSLCRGKTAILARCNLTVFSAAVRLTDANPLCQIHFVGVSTQCCFIYSDTTDVSIYISSQLQAVAACLMRVLPNFSHQIHLFGTIAKFITPHSYRIVALSSSCQE